MSLPRLLRQPFFLALAAGLLVLLAAFAPVLWQMLQPRPAPRALLDLPAPWQIEADDKGQVKAFGLRLPGATLADALALWGDDLQLGVIASRGQAPALEAYTERWVGGGVTGKLVLAAEAQGEQLRRWQDGAARRERLDADTERWHLRSDDRESALRSPVVGLSFLPSQKPDEATLKARFGEPAERLQAGGSQHWLYPARGLAMARDAGSGRLVLQVVALTDFERRLRAPLRAAVDAAPAPASAAPR